MMIVLTMITTLLLSVFPHLIFSIATERDVMDTADIDPNTMKQRSGRQRRIAVIGGSIAGTFVTKVCVIMLY